QHQTQPLGKEESCSLEWLLPFAVLTPLVPQELYLLIMKDTSLYHELEDEIIKLHQLVETVELKVADETPPPNKQVKPLFRHFRRIDSCLQTRVAFRGSDEIFCRVYMPDHSYVTIRSRLSASVQDILASVTEKLQYSEEQSARGDALILVTMASSGEKAVLQPSEECVFTTLGINSHLFACTRDTFDSLVPLPEEIQVVPGDTEIHRAEPEDVANHLTAFHWELFRCIHEVEFVDYVFHGERGRRETANLELLLQRCSEVQHWVGTELLLCEALGKRAHLLKKLIKIAAICKQNQDMLSFYAIVIGLNNAAISRLRLTWEKLPGKFKNLFRKFENLTDPCRNHKTYREVLAKMKPPLIPFVPLILKDLTFLHEGSKTLLDGLVNVEKLGSVTLLAQQQSGDTTRDVPVGRKALALASLLCWLRAVTHEPQSGVSLPGVFLSWIPANSLQQLLQHGRALPGATRATLAL
uniref:Rap guanine nucleotide exchange factor like 1 n=1 Tax=Junco hyemalis TaxID=40217 RepID=A0A8C5IDL6_JUNHY